MSAFQRTKGAGAERELCKLLSERLGFPITRVIRQHGGDADIQTLDMWSMEVKRYARADPSDIEAWWNQACRQAEQMKRFPLLAYRLDRQSWRFVIAMAHLAVEFAGQPWGLYATLGLDEALLVIRESLNGP